MPAPLQITQRSAAGVAVLEIGGQLVADEGDLEFKEHVAALVGAGCRCILLDLRNILYMDSGGAGVLAASYLHVVKRGGAMKLLAPSERVCRILQVTHLLSVFEIFDDQETAIRSFASPAPASIDRS
jgi:anti-sigma B factor antagonist